MDTYTATVAAQRLGIDSSEHMTRLVRIAKLLHQIDIRRSNGFYTVRQEKYNMTRTENLEGEASEILEQYDAFLYHNGDPRLPAIYAIKDVFKKYKAWKAQPWIAQRSTVCLEDYLMARGASDGVAIF